MVHQVMRERDRETVVQVVALKAILIRRVEREPLIKDMLVEIQSIKHQAAVVERVQ